MRKQAMILSVVILLLGLLALHKGSFAKVPSLGMFATAPTVFSATTPSPSVNVAHVAPIRFVNASLSSSNVDLYVDNNLIKKSIGYEETTEYTMFPPGKHRIIVKRLGNSDLHSIDEEYIFPAGIGVTIVVRDQSSTLDYYLQDLNPIHGSSNVAFIDAVVSNSALDVYFSLSSSPIRTLNTLDPGKGWIVFNIPSSNDTYFDIDIIDHLSGGTVAARHGRELSANTIYTVIAIGSATQGAVNILILEYSAPIGGVSLTAPVAATMAATEYDEPTATLPF